MKKIPVEEAIGHVLAHDMTKIIPDVYKGVPFKKGHIIRSEDIEALKDMGKNHIFIYEKKESDCHENEGAQRVGQAVAGQNIEISAPLEGKVHLVSQIFGRLTVNVTALEEIHEGTGIILATRHHNTVVNPSERVAGAKIIPLLIDNQEIEAIENYVKEHGPILEVIPFKPLKVGIVVTGTEVFEGRIVDAFAPVLTKKIMFYQGELLEVRFAPDDEAIIKAEIEALVEGGAELVMVSGGMSVDPDDCTPLAIKAIATEVITYGSPVLPGAMFMLAYYDEIPIIGIPACGMFNKITVLDLVLPYLFTAEKVTKKMIGKMAHGGLCLQCETCHYPNCAFGGAR